MDSDFRSYTKRHLKRNLFMAWISSISMTTKLIIVNIALFLAFIVAVLFVKEEILLNFLALNPNNLFLKGYVWTLLTSMFMHANFFHLIVNMFSLYFVGNFLETIIGRRRFFWFYFISGIFAGLFFSLLSFIFGPNEIGARLLGSPEIFAVGASGAIFGIAGVLAVMVPKSKVYLIAGPLIAIALAALAGSIIENPQAISAIDLIANVYIVFSLLVLFSFNSRFRALIVPIKMPFSVLPWVAIIPLFAIGFFVKDFPIGNSAHLGGLIAGLIYGYYLKLKYKNKAKLIEKYFS
jgi:membrane associated rhomboid family serine protease